MKLFISHPSDQKELAERLRLALEAEGHEVFTDRAELKEGEPYTRRCARPSKHRTRWYS